MNTPLFFEPFGTFIDTLPTALPISDEARLYLRQSGQSYTAPLSAISATLGGGGHEILTANRTYYVNPVTGSDSSDGLTPGTAFQTVDQAIYVAIPALDTNTFTVTVQLADGTYPGGYYPAYVPGTNVNYVGNTTTPANVVINNDGYSCFDVNGGMNGAVFDGMTFNIDGGAWGGIVIDGIYNGVSVNRCRCRGSGRAFIFNSGNPNSITTGFLIGGGSDNTVGITLEATFSGEAGIFSYAGTFIIVADGSLWTFGAGAQVSSGFIVLDHASFCDIYNVTFTGTLIGNQFNCAHSSSISSVVRIPGTVRGITDQRTKLKGDLNLYVRSDGNDLNDGTANDSTHAKLTFAGAFADVKNLYDFGGFTVTISMQNTTWTVPCVFDSPTVGGGFIILEMNGSTISVSSGTNYCIDVTNCPTQITVQNYTLTSTVAGGVQVSAFGNLTTAGTNAYGARLAGTASICSNGGVLNVLDDVLTMSTNSNFAILSNGASSQLFFYPSSLVLSGTPAYSRSFALCQGLAYLEAFQTNTVTTGTATGTRYDITLNGVIQTFGSGANNFPGNVAGTTSSGGQYA